MNPNSTRKLWVLHGEAKQLFNQLSNTIDKHHGDWITVTAQSDLPDYLPNIVEPTKTKALLGQQYLHAIFDATEAFNLDAFAMLVGTLVKGSVLILLLPQNFNDWQDQDSLRWNESCLPIGVPNFVAHLQQTLAEFAGFLSQDFPPIDTLAIDVSEQQKVLTQLLESDKRINVLLAKRGRGKSALAGLFSRHQPCQVTAPNKGALATFFEFAKPDIRFDAPDDLIENATELVADYLIIDEAAMIPLPMLDKLLNLALAQNRRVLLTTTVEGYEGTGQGFLLKLLHDKSYQIFALNTPIRWQAGDVVEQFTDRLLLNGGLSKADSSPSYSQSVSYSKVDRSNISLLRSIFYLLKMAHYQTTLIDLRRLFDAQNLSVFQATMADKTIAAAVTIDEGNLPDELIEQVWQGSRRPKGNLVAQSLVAHAGEKQAAQLHSLRINRIVVASDYRRQHIAKQLIETIMAKAINQHHDFLSVSFAYSEENYRFWLACGFTPVHIASHKQASSGSYSVMALRPLTEQGQALTDKLQRKLARNAFWLKNIIDLPFDTMLNIDDNQHLSIQDIDELYGFCCYHRPFQATYAALCRLCQHHEQQLPLVKLTILKTLLHNPQSEQQVIKQYHLTGRNDLMKAIKQEVKQCLKSLF